jgi:penicillin amidase
MWVTGFQPRPWDPYSVLLIGNLLSFAGLSVVGQENERLMMELIQLGIDDERLRELFHPYLDGIDFEPLREVRIAKRLSDDALELLADLPRLAGSNAWAVSPARSATNHALLASDPHLEVNRLPAIWYEVALNWGHGEYAMGATLPGTPIMAVGRTRKLAWGVTYMHADTSDYFIEDCRPGGATGCQFRRGTQWHDFQHRQEVIKRRGAADDPRRLRKRPRHAHVVAGRRGTGKIPVGQLDRRADWRRSLDRHLARRDVESQRRRRHGCRPPLAPSDARLGACRS